MASELGWLDLDVSVDDYMLDFDPSILLTPDSSSPSLDEIENELMNDHPTLNDLDDQSVSDFLSDILKVDSPPSNGKESSEKTPIDSGSESQDDDPVAKKRTRKLRNREAAVRSRERKKEYVKDLETKSKYLERECLRLGRILECFAAENQSLRLCLQKGGDNQNAPITRQESAVLFLESLLLGSLLWYLGSIICQYPHSQTKPLETDQLEKPVLSGGGSSVPLETNNWKSRRCKGSRPRMKQQIWTLVT